MASVAVIADYLRRRVLGMPPFAADGEEQFRMPDEKIKSRKPLRLPAKNKRNQDS
jgi:hypothetical protein